MIKNCIVSWNRNKFVVFLIFAHFLTWYVQLNGKEIQNVLCRYQVTSRNHIIFSSVFQLVFDTKYNISPAADIRHLSTKIKMEVFEKIVSGFQLFTRVTKHFILNVNRSPGHISPSFLALSVKIFPTHKYFYCYLNFSFCFALILGQCPWYCSISRN